MPENDILSQEYRSKIIQQLEGDENRRRKEESLKRWEIYNDRMESYVYEILRRDLSGETLQNMRVLSSVNLCKRIINEQSSIYNKRPKRQLIDSDDKTDELISNVYKAGRFNTGLKQANIGFNLQDQSAIQILPKDGKIKMKVLQPHHFDVIPSDLDPTKAEVYILSQFDKDVLFNQVDNSNNVSPQVSQIEYINKDQINQNIADSEDWKAKRGVYVWWSNNFHFSTNAKGEVLDPRSLAPISGEVPPELFINPIGKVPFVDVKEDTQDEYWQRFGNATVDFTLQMAIILSDVSEVNRLQGFAQPIISATEPPVNMKIGPNTCLFLKKSKNADPAAQPTFEFASPNPDLNGSIEMVRTFLSMFLTSKGLDPGVITADGTSTRYASGIDRLLSNIEKFEASQDDFELFQWVEKEVFKLVKAWLEALSGVTEGGLMDELSGIVPDGVNMDVNFIEPGTQVSQDEKEKSVINRLDNGLMSRVEAIMELRDLDENEARDVLVDIDEDSPLSQINSPLKAVGDDGDRE